MGAAFRPIPHDEVKSLSKLGLPRAIEQMAEKPHGSSSCRGLRALAKSTTLAAMIDKINRERYEHIMSAKDSIEFFHQYS